MKDPAVMGYVIRNLGAYTLRDERSYVESTRATLRRARVADFDSLPLRRGCTSCRMRNKYELRTPSRTHRRAKFAKSGRERPVKKAGHCGKTPRRSHLMPWSQNCLIVFVD